MHFLLKNVIHAIKQDIQKKKLSLQIAEVRMKHPWQLKISMGFKSAATYKQIHK